MIKYVTCIVKAKDAIPVLQKFVGQDISNWFHHYCGTADFPVRYKLEKANHREIVVGCYQNGKAWNITFRPRVFLYKIDWDKAPEELRKLS
jgi:hypothetical protein